MSDAYPTLSGSENFVPFYEDDKATIYWGDSLQVLPDLGPVDLVLTDPPYNVGKDYGGHDDSQTDDDYQAWLASVFAAADYDTLVFFPGKVNLFAAPDLLPDGFRVVRVLGWHRKEFAGDMWNGGPAMSWEPIVWATRLEKPFFNKKFGHMGRDFLVVPSTHGDPRKAWHPCPKPKRVMDWLVGLFATEGGTILDPFMGTGTTLRSAKDVGARAIGVEINEDYCRVAVRELAQEVLAV